MVKLIGQGEKGRIHAAKYITLDQELTFGNSSHPEIPINENVKIINVPVCRDDKWYVDVLHNNVKYELRTSSLHKPYKTNSLQAEDRQIQQLEYICLTNNCNNTNFNLVISNTTYEVNRVERVNGFKKADAVLVDNSGHSQVYISLKKNYKPSGTFGFGRVGTYITHDVVQEFILKLPWKEHPPQLSYAMELNASNNVHEDFMLHIMYGKEYNTSSFCEENVNYIIFGDISCHVEANAVILDCDCLYTNGTVYPNKIQLQTNYNIGRNDLRLKNTSVQLRQQGSRKVTHYV
jgi:hypothetical protein